MDPRYPIYIISKGRADTRMTSKALEVMKVPYRIVVEPQEHAQYAAVIDPAKILTLPFSNLGLGSIPARNWVWEHSIAEKCDRHWILDDNIMGFYRLQHGIRAQVRDGVAFRVIEDFVDRYVNVPMAGMNYLGLAGQGKTTEAWKKPFTFNRRIYSCILLSNKVPHRWRGRYNEDTDLSLRLLKDGYCTILFQAFLCLKRQSMELKGGNTDELYRKDEEFDGRLEMARSLQRQHPDVVKITRKWGRWQHQVNYFRFKGNKLIRRPGVEVPEGIDDYGMVLVRHKA